jgi:hypothetical protein
MELSETGPAGAWAPEACTLPASERPQRAAEFDELFAGTVRGIERAGPTRLRLDLQPSPRAAARAAELRQPRRAAARRTRPHARRPPTLPGPDGDDIGLALILGVAIRPAALRTAADEPAARTPAREDFRNEVVPGDQLAAAGQGTSAQAAMTKASTVLPGAGGR